MYKPPNYCKELTAAFSKISLIRNESAAIKLNKSYTILTVGL